MLCTWSATVKSFKNNQLLFSECFCLPRLSSACLWPSLPTLHGTVGLIDNCIRSWREEGEERWGSFFLSLLFLDTPLALFMHVLFSTVTNDLISKKHYVGHLQWGGPLSWTLCTKRTDCGCHSRVMHILGTTVRFCSWFKQYLLQQFSFHSSRKGNMRCFGLLSVTNCRSINVSFVLWLKI